MILLTLLSTVAALYVLLRDPDQPYCDLRIRTTTIHNRRIER